MTSSPVSGEKGGEAGAPRGMIRRIFLDHPASVGETYEEHFRVAGGVGIALLLGGLACFVHAVVPA